MNTEISEELKQKLDRLESYYKELGSLAVGFSGGVDSTFLLYTAHHVLGERAIALTATDAAFPERELRESMRFCLEYGIKQVLCSVDPMAEEHFRMNDKERCYHCKRYIFTELKKAAALAGIDHVAEGSNMDDLGDYRPGLRAVDELKIASPLRHAGLTKAEIRLLSEAMGLPTHDKPSYACLATRFVYGEEITKEKLSMVDRAEQVLIDRGYLQERVRIHGDTLARIEVPEDDIARIAETSEREAIDSALRAIGFQYITLDLKGYRTGSMNETLED